MPNGGSWDRFWFVLLGFHGQFGQWPTRVIVPVAVRAALDAHLAPSDRAKLEGKLEIVFGKDLIAQDAAGREYRYAGLSERKASEDPQEWLGIRWD